MKLKSLSLSVLAALSLGVATSAMAADATTSTTATEQTAPAYDHSGFWIGGALGMGYVSNDDINKFNGSANGEAPSVKLHMGYDFNQYFGIYGSYDYMHDLGTADLHLATLGMKGNLPLTEKLSTFAKVGATYIYADEKSFKDNALHMKSDSFSATAGLGLSYQITHALSTQIGADYYQNLRTSQGHADLTQAYWGMTYKFGQPATPMVITNNVEVVKEVAVESTVATRSSYILPYNNGKTELNEYGRYNLGEVIATMQANPEVNAQIIGRADKVGSSEINEKVSAKRAANVADYLVANGIDASRLTVSAVSYNDPIKTEANNDAYVQRSVQIILN